MDLQPIGLRHPAAELIRDIQHNRTGLPRRMFVAEGLWEHNLLLASAARLDTFLWCPEAAYSDEARTRAPELAARNGWPNGPARTACCPPPSCRTGSRARCSSARRR